MREVITMRLKSSKKILFGAVALLVLSACSTKPASQNVADDPTKTESIHGTTVSPVITSKQKFYDSLTDKYLHLKKSLDHDAKPESYTIPGLIKTRTISAGSNHLIGTSQQMDPQGLAVTPKYVIISAYSRDKKYNSVLFFLNKKTGAFSKQIVLPNTSHVGGLGYDTTSGRLWIATETATGKGSLSAYDASTIAHANFAKTQRTTPFDHVSVLPGLSRASFLTYHSNAIYVGFFNANHQGSFVSFPLAKNGMPQTRPNSETQLRGANDYQGTYNANKQLQGVTFYKGLILFSQSFGPQASTPEGIEAQRSCGGKA